MQKQLEIVFDRLWPVCRSILGPGFRESLSILEEICPFERISFSSGDQVFDWVVPPEWQPKEAYFIDPNGKRRCDFKSNNLHLLGYSQPFHGKIKKEDLEQHLYSLPELPKAIPYVTSYYKERWGFCISDAERKELPEGEYEVHIDAAHTPGQLVIGECVLPGEEKSEILFSSYLCHPSMANNELSGPLALCFLHQKLKALPRRRYTYRFVLSAETIGTIAYLSLRGGHLKNVLRAGYQLTCIGDRGPFTLKTSRRMTSLADRIAERVLQKKGTFRKRCFDPADGSDERQYCSPGFDLPIASLMRTMYAEYSEYHTSLDNKDFICFSSLQESILTLVEICQALEEGFDRHRLYKNMNGMCEPQLGKRGLYPTLGAQREVQEKVRAIMWTLNYSDGLHDLSQIADMSGCKLELIQDAAKQLEDHGLIRELALGSSSSDCEKNCVTGSDNL